MRHNARQSDNNKLYYSRILICSYLWSLGGQMYKWRNLNLVLLHYIRKQIDSMLLCICSAIDHRRLQSVVRTKRTQLSFVWHFFVLTTFWHHLISTTEQTHNYMESIRYIALPMEMMKKHISFPRVRSMHHWTMTAQLCKLYEDSGVCFVRYSTKALCYQFTHLGEKK